MNNIELSTKYIPLLDELYKQESKTAILEGDEVTVQKGNNGEIKIAKLDMDGLGDFSRSSGYTKGSTSFVWETVKYDKERSQDLRIDRLDNEEALDTPFAKLAGEFVRTKVVPETDAARIAKICGTEGISTKAETLSTGADVISALRTASNTQDEDEVPTETRILFITPTLKGMVDDLDTTKSQKVLNKFSTIIEIPQSRMYTAIDLFDGESQYGYCKHVATYELTTDDDVVEGKTYYTRSGSGTSESPYVYTAVETPVKADIATYYECTSEAGKEINFLVVEKSAAVCALTQYIKYFTPDQDQDGDSHVFKYRNNNLYAHCYENKLAGIYVSYES